MIKKIYEKPNLTTEKFDLSQSIAGSCSCVVLRASVDGDNKKDLIPAEEYLQKYKKEDAKFIEVLHGGINNENKIYTHPYNKDTDAHHYQHPGSSDHNYLGFTYFWS